MQIIHLTRNVFLQRRKEQAKADKYPSFNFDASMWEKHSQRNMQFAKSNTGK